MDLNSLDPEHEPWKPHTWISEEDEEYCDYDPGTFEWYQSESDILKWEFQQLVQVRKWTRLLLKKCMLEYFKSKQMRKWTLQVIMRFHLGGCSYLDVPDEGMPIQRSEVDPGVGAEPSGGHHGGHPHPGKLRRRSDEDSWEFIFGVVHDNSVRYLNVGTSDPDGPTSGP